MKLPLNSRGFRWLLYAVAAAVCLEIADLCGAGLAWPYEPLVCVALILCAGYETLWEGLEALVRLRFSSINLLITIAVVAAFILGEYCEAAVVVTLFTLGERLEDIGITGGREALERLAVQAPRTARLPDGQQRDVTLIDPGTVVCVKPHERIPIDGAVTAGSTTVDESTITGEAIPKSKKEGDTVYAGTLNMDGYIELATSCRAADTTYSRIIELTRTALSNRSDAQKFIQRFAAVYTPIIMLLSVCVFVIPVFLLHLDLHKWLNQAISLLVISCPCALVISTPVAVYAAIGNASARGILIKGGKYLEAVARVKVMAFDKTGTLTCGHPVVTDVRPAAGVSPEELLACSAGAERLSEHPLAKAVVVASANEGFVPHEVTQFKSVAGKGAMATCIDCGNEQIFVGSKEFIAARHQISPDIAEWVDVRAIEGKTCVIVCCGGAVKGAIAMSDRLRPHSIETVGSLKRLGITPVLLSGDSREAVGAVAAQSGIAQWRGAMLPDEKVSIITALLATHESVAMVGDGVNDAPALATATVGIAMGAAGSAVAIETAGIALMNDRIDLLPFLVSLGRRTATVIRRNTVGAVAVKVLFVALSLLGFSNLVFAIVADVGIMLIVVLSSLRLITFNKI
ncbi:MAG: cation-translocating P-type ATPase [Bacteroidales bacterium]|jgi:Cd2+/Zn2+-exporting ATPase|nr:cation-translocating P-type ATPase [Bacteroidales bacterium]